MAQTLQDFVLTLMQNPEARNAFDADPQDALGNAGLEDVTAADVQDVMPMVLDTVSLDDLGSLTGGQEDFGSLNTGPVELLQRFSQQFDAIEQTTGNLDSNAVTGSLAVLTEDLTGNLGAAGDLSDSLDDISGVGGVGDVQSPVESVTQLGDVALGGGVVDGGTNPTAITDNLGDVHGTVGDLTGAEGQADVLTTVGDLTGDLDGSLGDIAGAGFDNDSPLNSTVGDLTSSVGEVTGVDAAKAVSDNVTDIARDNLQSNAVTDNVTDVVDNVGNGNLNDVVGNVGEVGDINVGDIGSGNVIGSGNDFGGNDLGE